MSDYSADNVFYPDASIPPHQSSQPQRARAGAFRGSAHADEIEILRQRTNALFSSGQDLRPPLQRSASFSDSVRSLDYPSFRPSFRQRAKSISEIPLPRSQSYADYSSDQRFRSSEPRRRSLSFHGKASVRDYPALNRRKLSLGDNPLSDEAIVAAVRSQSPDSPPPRQRTESIGVSIGSESSSPSRSRPRSRGRSRGRRSEGRSRALREASVSPESSSKRQRTGQMVSAGLSTESGLRRALEASQSQSSSTSSIPQPIRAAPPIPARTRAPLPPMPSPPEPEPDRAYKEYLREKAAATGGQPYAYSGYNPSAPPGPHQPFGRQVRGQKHKEYPEPTQLGQSSSWYSMNHPSEADLPRLPVTGGTAVFGVNRDAKGNVRAICGPAEYYNFYMDWKDVGDRVNEGIPADMPLPADELDFLAKYGFTFGTKLGSGGFGSVWAVETTRLYRNDRNEFVRRDVACKVLSLNTFRENGIFSVRQAVDKLLDESLIHKDLHHPNVVECGHVFHIHDEVTGFPFCRCLIFMEKCDGDLKSIIMNHPNGHYDENEARYMFKQVTAGLKYLHDQNTVHLDLKFHNVLYVKGPTGLVFKLADFGLTRKAVPKEGIRVVGQVGTKRYFPPEMLRQALGSHDAKKLDIYCLASILAECLSGRNKFRGMIRDLHQYWPQVANKWGIGQECRDLLVSMTDLEPANRPDINQVQLSQWFGGQS